MIKKYGYVWKNSKYSNDEYESVIDHRFRAITWKFGKIHQAKVIVSQPNSEEEVGTYLRYSKTRDEAIKRCIDWIDQYQKDGAPSAKECFDYCHKYFPDIFPNRIAVIDQLFFVVGNGYDWLDGAIISTCPDSHLEMPQNKEYEDSYLALTKLIDINLPFKEDSYQKAREQLWNTGTYLFYPASESYSNICHIPGDVKPEWLVMACYGL